MGGEVRWLLLLDIDGGTVAGTDLAINVTLPPAVVGVPYVGGLYVATGGAPPYTYATSAGSLPTGLGPVDASTGVIPGTPTAAGYFEFTAAVTDSASNTASRVVAMTVGSGIAISGAFQPGEVGIAYASLLSASGGTPPYTWTVASGSLPTSLSINSSTGYVTGTPSVAGTFNVTIRATDSASVPQDFPTSITIAAAVDLSTSTFTDGIVGVAYSAGPTTVGGVAPFSYSISSGAIPLGCNFTSATGAVTGAPTTAATYNFDVTVLDALGGTSTYAATVVISAGGGGSGIATINTITPDGSQDFGLTSVDGSVILTPATHGIDISVAKETQNHGCTFTNGNLVLTGTLKGQLTIGLACNIAGWTILGDQGVSGTASISVSHSTLASYGTPTSLFTATVTSADHNSASGLTNAVAAGDVLYFVGSGWVNFTQVAITLNLVPA